MALKGFKTSLSNATLLVGSRLLSSDHLSPILRKLYGKITGNLKRHQLFLIRGYVGNSNRTITVFVGGCKEFVYLQAKRACWENHRTLVLGKAFRWQTNIPDSSNADIIMLCAPKQHRRKLEKNGYALLPIVNFVLDLHGSVDEIVEKMSGRRRKNIKKLHNYDYSYIISRRSLNEFNHFYWNMYLPYAKCRFQKGAYLEPYLKLKEYYESKGGIVFVKHGNELISGILFYSKGQTLCAKVYGTHAGDFSLNDDIVGQGALFSLIRWAKSQGFTKLDYGLTPPFIRDGLFIYKKEWGMRLEHLADHFFCYLKINHFNEGALSFLEQNPFIFMDQHAMKALALVNGEVTHEGMLKIVSAYSLRGLDSLTVASRNTQIRGRIVSDESPLLLNSDSETTESDVELLRGLRRLGFEISTFRFASENSVAIRSNAAEIAHTLTMENREN